MAASGGLWPRFLRITKIGDSQKARQRAWTHAMTHSNERACINTHDDSCGSCMTCPCACGMRHRQEMVSGARRVTRHVFLRRTSGLSELKCTCKHRESPLCNGAGLRRWSPPCPNAAKYAVGKQRVDGQREAKQKQDSDSNVANRKRTDFWSSSPSRSASPPPDITPQADTTVQV